MKMQKLICIIAAVVVLSSCTDWDNYDEPEETLRGQIINAETGDPFQTEVGANGVRIRLMEYSWSENPEPFDFFAMQDGKFNHEKLFEGEYGVQIQGAFVPVDEVVTNIAGVSELNFEVEPFLNIELIGEPVVEKGSISIDYRITRGTDNVDHQADLSDIWLFVNTSSEFVGDNNFDRSISEQIRRPGEDEMNTVSTFKASGLEGDRTYYFRVAARTNETVAGTRRYNYSKPMSVDVPAP